MYQQCTSTRCGADLQAATPAAVPELDWNARVGHRPPHIHTLRPEVGIRNSYPRCAIPGAHEQPSVAWVHSRLRRTNAP